MLTAKTECKNWRNVNLLKVTANISIFNVYAALKAGLNIYIWENYQGFIVDCHLFIEIFKDR